MRTTEWQNAVRHLRSWAPTLFVAVLLFGFVFIALEVTEGEPIASDRRLTVALRDASDLSRPIGPPWLLDVVRDITALGSTAVLALLVTIVTTFLFATGKRHAGLFVLTTVLSGALLNTLLKLAFARTRPDPEDHASRVSGADAACHPPVWYLRRGDDPDPKELPRRLSTRFLLRH